MALSNYEGEKSKVIAILAGMDVQSRGLRKNAEKLIKRTKKPIVSLSLLYLKHYQMSHIQATKNSCVNLYSFLVY